MESVVLAFSRSCGPSRCVLQIFLSAEGCGCLSECRDWSFALWLRPNRFLRGTFAVLCWLCLLQSVFCSARYLHDLFTAVISVFLIVSNTQSAKCPSLTVDLRKFQAELTFCRMSSFMQVCYWCGFLLVYCDVVLSIRKLGPRWSI